MSVCIVRLNNELLIELLGLPSNAVITGVDFPFNLHRVIDFKIEVDIETKTSPGNCPPYVSLHEIQDIKK